MTLAFSYVHTEEGDRLAAGLVWKSTAADPGWRIGANGAALVREDPEAAKDSRYVLADGMEAEGAASLLLAMADGLAAHVDLENPTEPGDWLFVARTEPDATHPEGRYWLAQATVSDTTEDGLKAIPAPRPEELRDSFEEFIQAATEIASVWIMAGLAVVDADPFADRVTLALVGAGVFEESRIRRVVPQVGNQPVFRRLRRITVAGVATVLSASAAVVAAILLLPGYVVSLAAPSPPVQLVSAVVAKGAFRSTCSGSLAGWWPRIAGWQVRSSGCALAGHVPPSLGIEPSDPLATGASTVLVFWRRLALEDGANPVLAEGAALRVLEGWPHGFGRDREGMVLWRSSALSLVAVPDAPPSQPEASNARLAALWADTPGAVNEGQGGYVITAPGVPEDLLGRASSASGLAPVLLEASESGPTVMVLQKPATRALPAALLSDTQGSDGESEKGRDR